MNKIRVRRCRTGSQGNRLTGSHNWRVEQRVVPGSVRVFTYRRWWMAIENADRLTKCRGISSFGLRGFHIEYDDTTRVVR